MATIKPISEEDKHMIALKAKQSYCEVYDINEFHEIEKYLNLENTIESEILNLFEKMSDEEIIKMIDTLKDNKTAISLIQYYYLKKDVLDKC